MKASEKKIITLFAEANTGNNDDEPAIELLRRCLEGKR